LIEVTTQAGLAFVYFRDSGFISGPRPGVGPSPPGGRGDITLAAERARALSAPPTRCLRSLGIVRVVPSSSPGQAGQAFWPLADGTVSSSFRARIELVVPLDTRPTPPRNAMVVLREPSSPNYDSISASCIRATASGKESMKTWSVLYPAATLNAGGPFSACLNDYSDQFD
jgi:hypothetical protein